MTLSRLVNAIVAGERQFQSELQTIKNSWIPLLADVLSPDECIGLLEPLSAVSRSSCRLGVLLDRIELDTPQSSAASIERAALLIDALHHHFVVNATALSDLAAYAIAHARWMSPFLRRVTNTILTSGLHSVLEAYAQPRTRFRLGRNRSPVPHHALLLRFAAQATTNPPGSGTKSSSPPTLSRAEAQDVLLARTAHLAAALAVPLGRLGSYRRDTGALLAVVVDMASSTPASFPLLRSCFASASAAAAAAAAASPTMAPRGGSSPAHAPAYRGDGVVPMPHVDGTGAHGRGGSLSLASPSPYVPVMAPTSILGSPPQPHHPFPPTTGTTGATATATATGVSSFAAFATGARDRLGSPSMPSPSPAVGFAPPHGGAFADGAAAGADAARVGAAVTEVVLMVEQLHHVVDATWVRVAEAVRAVTSDAAVAPLVEKFDALRGPPHAVPTTAVTLAEAAKPTGRGVVGAAGQESGAHTHTHTTATAASTAAATGGGTALSGLGHITSAGTSAASGARLGAAGGSSYDGTTQYPPSSPPPLHRLYHAVGSMGGGSGLGFDPRMGTSSGHSTNGYPPGSAPSSAAGTPMRVVGPGPRGSNMHTTGAPATQAQRRSAAAWPLHAAGDTIYPCCASAEINGSECAAVRREAVDAAVRQRLHGSVPRHPSDAVAGFVAKFAARGRRLLHDGSVVKQYSRGVHRRHLFLFSDGILYTSPPPTMAVRGWISFPTVASPNTSASASNGMYPRGAPPRPSGASSAFQWGSSAAPSPRAVTPPAASEYAWPPPAPPFSVTRGSGAYTVGASGPASPAATAGGASVPNSPAGRARRLSAVATDGGVRASVGGAPPLAPPPFASAFGAAAPAPSTSPASPRRGRRCCGGAAGTVGPWSPLDASPSPVIVRLLGPTSVTSLSSSPSAPGAPLMEDGLLMLRIALADQRTTRAASDSSYGFVVMSPLHKDIACYTATREEAAYWAALIEATVALARGTVPSSLPFLALGTARGSVCGYTVPMQSRCSDCGALATTATTDAWLHGRTYFGTHPLLPFNADAALAEPHPWPAVGLPYDTHHVPVGPALSSPRHLRRARSLPASHPALAAYISASRRSSAAPGAAARGQPPEAPAGAGGSGSAAVADAGATGAAGAPRRGRRVSDPAGTTSAPSAHEASSARHAPHVPGRGPVPDDDPIVMGALRTDSIDGSGTTAAAPGADPADRKVSSRCRSPPPPDRSPRHVGTSGDPAPTGTSSLVIRRASLRSVDGGSVDVASLAPFGSTHADDGRAGQRAEAPAPQRVRTQAATPPPRLGDAPPIGGGAGAPPTAPSDVANGGGVHIAPLAAAGGAQRRVGTGGSVFRSRSADDMTGVGGVTHVGGGGGASFGASRATTTATAAAAAGARPAPATSAGGTGTIGGEVPLRVSVILRTITTVPAAGLARGGGTVPATGGYAGTAWRGGVQPYHTMRAETAAAGAAAMRGTSQPVQRTSVPSAGGNSGAPPGTAGSALPQSLAAAVAASSAAAARPPPVDGTDPAATAAATAAAAAAAGGIGGGDGAAGPYLHGQQLLRALYWRGLPTTVASLAVDVYSQAPAGGSAIGPMRLWASMSDDEDDSGSDMEVGATVGPYPGDVVAPTPPAPAALPGGGGAVPAAAARPTVPPPSRADVGIGSIAKAATGTHGTATAEAAAADAVGGQSVGGPGGSFGGVPLPATTGERRARRASAAGSDADADNGSGADDDDDNGGLVVPHGADGADGVDGPVLSRGRSRTASYAGNADGAVVVTDGLVESRPASRGSSAGASSVGAPRARTRYDGPGVADDADADGGDGDADGHLDRGDVVSDGVTPGDIVSPLAGPAITPSPTPLLPASARAAGQPAGAPDTTSTTAAPSTNTTTGMGDPFAIAAADTTASALVDTVAASIPPLHGATPSDTTAAVASGALSRDGGTSIDDLFGALGGTATDPPVTAINEPRPVPTTVASIDDIFGTIAPSAPTTATTITSAATAAPPAAGAVGAEAAVHDVTGVEPAELSILMMTTTGGTADVSCDNADADASLADDAVAGAAVPVAGGEGPAADVGDVRASDPFAAGGPDATGTAGPSGGSAGGSQPAAARARDGTPTARARASERDADTTVVATTTPRVRRVSNKSSSPAARRSDGARSLPPSAPTPLSPFASAAGGALSAAITSALTAASLTAQSAPLGTLPTASLSTGSVEHGTLAAVTAAGSATGAVNRTATAGSTGSGGGDGLAGGLAAPATASRDASSTNGSATGPHPVVLGAVRAASTVSSSSAGTSHAHQRGDATPAVTLPTAVPHRDSRDVSLDPPAHASAPGGHVAPPPQPADTQGLGSGGRDAFPMHELYGPPYSPIPGTAGGGARVSVSTAVVAAAMGASAPAAAQRLTPPLLELELSPAVTVSGETARPPGGDGGLDAIFDAASPPIRAAPVAAGDDDDPTSGGAPAEGGEGTATSAAAPALSGEPSAAAASPTVDARIIATTDATPVVSPALLGACGVPPTGEVESFAVSFLREIGIGGPFSPPQTAGAAATQRGRAGSPTFEIPDPIPLSGRPGGVGVGGLSLSAAAIGGPRSRHRVSDASASPSPLLRQTHGGGGVSFSNPSGALPGVVPRDSLDDDDELDAKPQAGRTDGPTTPAHALFSASATTAVAAGAGAADPRAAPGSLLSRSVDAVGGGGTSIPPVPSASIVSVRHSRHADPPHGGGHGGFSPIVAGGSSGGGLSSFVAQPASVAAASAARTSHPGAAARSVPSGGDLGSPVVGWGGGLAGAAEARSSRGTPPLGADGTIGAALLFASTPPSPPPAPVPAPDRAQDAPSSPLVAGADPEPPAVDDDAGASTASTPPPRASSSPPSRVPTPLPLPALTTTAPSLDRAATPPGALTHLPPAADTAQSDFAFAHPATTTPQQAPNPRPSAGTPPPTAGAWAFAPFTPGPAAAPSSSAAVADPAARASGSAASPSRGAALREADPSAVITGTPHVGVSPIAPDLPPSLGFGDMFGGMGVGGAHDGAGRAPPLLGPW